MGGISKGSEAELCDGVDVDFSADVQSVGMRLSLGDADVTCQTMGDEPLTRVVEGGS